MPLYLTFTTAKVKIKLLSYFFPNFYGCSWYCIVYWDWRYSYIGFTGFCKNHFLKEDLLCVLKMGSLWAPFCKILCFFWTKYCNSSRLKPFLQGKGNSFNFLLLARQIKITFCLLFVLFSCKKILFKVLFLLIATEELTC